MNLSGRVIEMAVLVCLAFSAPTWPGAGAAQPTADTLIVPGERIGSISLRGHRSDLVRIYGRSYTEGPGFWPGSTFYEWRSAGLTVIADDTTGGLLWISIALSGPGSWDGYATEAGLGLGVTEETVLARMVGPPRTVSHGQGKDLDFPERGITFAIAGEGPQAGRVVALRIRWAPVGHGEMTIVPGQRIASVSLGMTIEAAQAALGAGYTLRHFGRLDRYFWPKNVMGVGAVDGRVVEIVVGWDRALADIGIRYITEEGIGLNSPAQQVKETLGEPASRMPQDVWEWWFYRERGIGFGVSTRPPLGMIVTIMVFAKP